MAGLIDEDDLREMFAISVDIADARLTRHLGAASRRLIGWVGQEAYDDAAATSPEDVDRKADFELAEAHIAMHFALLGLNTQLRATGLVKTEKVEGDTVISYLVPSEVKQLAEQYLEQAEEIVREYLINDVSNATAMAFVDLL